MIIYYAIKRLRYGKILMSVIALLPTSMVLASSYSYDWWVIALTLAGNILLYRKSAKTGRNLAISGSVYGGHLLYPWHHAKVGILCDVIALVFLSEGKI